DILSDAQQDRIYTQLYRRETAGGPMAADSKLEIQSFTEWLAARGSSAWVSGPGLYRFRDRLGERGRIVESARWAPQVHALLAICRARHSAGLVDNAAALEPLYLRPSSAEEKWKFRLEP